MRKNPVFIVGCGRSGTTLLRLMLLQSDELHIPLESGFFGTLSKRQSAYGDFTETRQRWFFIRDLQLNPATSKRKSFSVFEMTPREAESILMEAAPTDLAGATAALFEATAQKHEKKRWGDKTPSYIRHLPELAEAFPDAQFVHLIRDGRDVAASMRDAGWNTSIREGIRQWNHDVTVARHSVGRALKAERYREVFYEQLVRNPEETLQSLCEWLHLHYTPDMLNFHENSTSRLPEETADTLHSRAQAPIDASRAAAWKQSLPSWEVAEAEDEAGELLAELGYELTGRPIPNWLRGFRLFDKAASRLVRHTHQILSDYGLR